MENAVNFSDLKTGVIAQNSECKRKVVLLTICNTGQWEWVCCRSHLFFNLKYVQNIFLLHRTCRNHHQKLFFTKVFNSFFHLQSNIYMILSLRLIQPSRITFYEK